MIDLSILNWSQENIVRYLGMTGVWYWMITWPLLNSSNIFYREFSHTISYTQFPNTYSLFALVVSSLQTICWCVAEKNDAFTQVEWKGITSVLLYVC